MLSWRMVAVEDGLKESVPGWEHHEHGMDCWCEPIRLGKEGNYVICHSPRVCHSGTGQHSYVQVGTNEKRSVHFCSVCGYVRPKCGVG